MLQADGVESQMMVSASFEGWKADGNDPEYRGSSQSHGLQIMRKLGVLGAKLRGEHTMQHLICRFQNLKKTFGI
jgi:hypothetical protein